MLWYYSTNDKSIRVTFEEAILKGQPDDFGLYMIPRRDIPKLSPSEIDEMPSMDYTDIAFKVLHSFLKEEIPKTTLKEILLDAYQEEKIPTEVEMVNENTHILWLTKGPTYSFKDYAARFFGRALNYFLEKNNLRRTVIVATSGDTGGAVADALYNLDTIDAIVFFPKGSISEEQRRQMTTLQKNIYAFEVNGDFDVCQSLAKNLLGDKEFARTVFQDPERLTSANSISLGRLLPQAIYPFFAYSRIINNDSERLLKPIIASIPSGNFGDMMGTVIAKEMGLPILKIICGVNENKEFPEFLNSGKYEVHQSISSPSSAMIVSHPSNLARLIDFYGGQMSDERDNTTRKVVRPGMITVMPDMEAMRRDLFSVSVDNPQHYATINDVYHKYGVLLDPHGAVGWQALKLFRDNNPSSMPAVIYETADPGKFPEDIVKAIGLRPKLPSGMKKQATLEERVYSIKNGPENTSQGFRLSDAQIEEAKKKINIILHKEA